MQETNHGQTSANRTKPGPSLKVEKRLCLCYLRKFLLSKTSQLKVENSAQTTFRFSPVRYRAPLTNTLAYLFGASVRERKVLAHGPQSHPQVEELTILKDEDARACTTG